MGMPLSFPVAESAIQHVLPKPVAADTYDQSAIGLLNHLRLVALRCRCSARTDLLQACAVLSHDHNQATGAYAEVLVRCLSQILGRTPHFNRPSVDELSFDEQWLMSLILCHSRKDGDSFMFLMRSRVPVYAHRNLRFLIGAISEHLSKK